MKVFALLFVGVAMLLLPSEGSEDDDHFVMYGPHGEYVDENTPFFYLEDDHGNPQKVYIASPNVSYAIPPLMLRSTVRFHLYTKDTAHTKLGEQLFVGEDYNLKTSRFDPRLPVKVLIHGLGNSIDSDTIQEPMKAYLETGHYNVIGVDWGDACPFPFYDYSMGNTISAGNYVAEFLQYLMERFDIDPENIHVIGHSLGAHVSGIAGYKLGHTVKVGRVTGLDPAGPLYGSVPITEKLNPDDGQFVDVIHTCGGYGLPQLGLQVPVGMADFYPNGGSNDQPGCDSSWWMWYIKRYTCSHSKAHQLWTESIRNPSKFPAYQCDSLEEATDQKCKGGKRALMGDGADPKIYGLFSLKTD